MAKSSLGRSRNASAATDPPPADPPATAPPPEQPKGEMEVEVVYGDIGAVETPVAVVGRYLDTPAGGAMRGFNRGLGGWLQVAIERGVIGSLLGELAFVPIPKRAGGIKCGTLVVGGMGDVGRFTRNDLAYLISNVALAVRSLGAEGFAVVLIGTGSRGMPVARSVRGIVDGVFAAFEHMPAGLERKLKVTFCARTLAEAKQARAELGRIRDELGERFRPAGGRLKQVGRPEKPRRVGPRSRTAREAEDATPPNRVSITRPESASEAAATGRPVNTVLECAAMTDAAVVPVRTHVVQTYFLDRLSEIFKTREWPEADQKRLGDLLVQYLIPADMHGLIHGDEGLTLILDVATAAVPWEMAYYRRLSSARYYGTDLRLTRQFRTTQSAAPGIAPPVNDHLRVLLIADPAGGEYALDGARNEAAAVLRALADAHRAWDGKLVIKVTLCVGPPGTPQAAIDKLVSDSGAPPEFFEPDPKPDPDDAAPEPKPGPCDPLGVMGLLLRGKYDIVHFAGHGEYDPAAGRMGWVLDGGSRLTAAEVLKARRVPRLVFANACHSAKVKDIVLAPAPLPVQMTGMAEAFFKQGVANYLGTGWEVDDGLAAKFATKFYEQALRRGDEDRGPGPLAWAAAQARLEVRKEARENKPGDTTWGAYQFYGQPDATIIRVEEPDAR